MAVTFLSTYPTNTTVGQTVGCSGTLANGGTCTITITPGSTPNTTSTSTPAPTLFLVNGSNTNIIAAGFEVLTYGNLYEDANIYSVDDTVNLTTPNGSIGGAGLFTSTNYPSFNWSNTNDLIPGIQFGTTSTCDPTQLTNTDGQCNTGIINAYYSSASQNYAAGYCKALGAGGYDDWYLPAICEIGYGTIVPSTVNCGTQSNPTAQNIWSNLYPSFPDFNGLSLWSSTEVDTNTAMYGIINQTLYINEKVDGIRVGCARQFTNPT
jgi:hypothetical protein